jgi:hypothetical protein
MSKFSSDWLTLREPVDHRSRNILLQSQVVDYLYNIKSADAKAIRLMDIGSGTGSNLRALAPHLHTVQYWTLCDHDAELLHTARQVLLAWGDEEISHTAVGLEPFSNSSIQPVAITKQNKKIYIGFREIDLFRDFRSILDEPVDIFTAAAFFDLVSDSWLTEFCAYLSKPLYCVLTYDGAENWYPPEKNDSIILQAFHQHQSTDKGFGPALGPAAINRMQYLLENQHFNVVSAQSPWILTKDDQDLIEQLVTGTAQAVRETSTVSIAKINQWISNRLCSTDCRIGHVDIFAYK